MAIRSLLISVTVDAVSNPARSTAATLSRLMRQLGSELSHCEQFVASQLRSMPDDPREGISGDGFARRRIGSSVRNSRNDEPYRAQCRFIAPSFHELWNTFGKTCVFLERRSSARSLNLYLKPEELLTDLEILPGSSSSERSIRAQGTVQTLIRLVQVFGLHMLTLDIRQHSMRHTSAIDEVFAWSGIHPRYAKLSPNERFDCLAHEFESPSSFYSHASHFPPKQRGHSNVPNDFGIARATIVQGD